MVNVVYFCIIKCAIIKRIKLLRCYVSMVLQEELNLHYFKLKNTTTQKMINTGKKTRTIPVMRLAVSISNKKHL